MLMHGFSYPAAGPLKCLFLKNRRLRQAHQESPWGAARSIADLATVLWSVLSTSSTIPTAHPTTYVPRGANILRLIFHDHFPAFVQSYDSLYAKDFGKFRLQRISHVVDKFENCGDYTKGCAVTD